MITTFHGQRVTSPDRFVQLVLRLGELPSVRAEKRYLRKDGAVAWIELTVALVRNAAGWVFARRRTVTQMIVALSVGLFSHANTRVFADHKPGHGKGGGGDSGGDGGEADEGADLDVVRADAEAAATHAIHPLDLQPVRPDARDLAAAGAADRLHAYSAELGHRQACNDRSADHRVHLR